MHCDPVTAVNALTNSSSTVRNRTDRSASGSCRALSRSSDTREPDSFSQRGVDSLQLLDPRVQPRDLGLIRLPLLGALPLQLPAPAPMNHHGHTLPPDQPPLPIDLERLRAPVVDPVVRDPLPASQTNFVPHGCTSYPCTNSRISSAFNLRLTIIPAPLTGHRLKHNQSGKAGGSRFPIPRVRLLHRVPRIHARIRPCPCGGTDRLPRPGWWHF